MSKTITHEGKVYEIGKYYLFRDDEEEWGPAELVYFDANGTYPFRSHGIGYKCIAEMPQSEIGTIEDAPVELIDGEWYMFDSGGNIGLIAVYKNGWLRTTLPAVYLQSECTNIRKMVVE